MINENQYRVAAKNVLRYLKGNQRPYGLKFRRTYGIVEGKLKE